MFGLDTAPPSAATPYEIKPTLIISIWCTCYAVVIILFRCCGRWMRTGRLWPEDMAALLSIPAIVARMSLAAFVLKYGTNNVAQSALLGAEDIRRREIGSQLVLGCRAVYATSLWTIKLSVGIYISQLTNQFWAAMSLTSQSSHGRAIKTFLSQHLNHLFYTFLGASYVGVLISEAAECRPFTNYWQVTPTAAPSCRLAPENLFTMGIFSMLVDLLLVVLPLPMILAARLPRKVKAETVLLMLFPLINIGFTCYRLPSVTANRGSQLHRTLLASIDILVSTASANALVVICCLQDRGLKKLKYNHPEGDDGLIEKFAGPGVELKSIRDVRALTCPRAVSTGQVLSPPPFHQRSIWGSDEDLMRDDIDDGPMVHTTRSEDAELGTLDMTTPGPVGINMSSTKNLSPHQEARTSIVAIRRMSRTELEEDVAAQLRLQPSLAGLKQGIVVETSWKVQISQT